MSDFLFVLPAEALFDSFSVVALRWVVGELLQERTRKFRAFTAMPAPFGFATRLDGAVFAPKRLFNLDATRASCRLMETASAAYDSAS